MPDFVVPLSAQISRDAKFDILRTVIADQAASRIALPFGTGGVDLSDAGEVNKQKLDTDIKKNGQSIEVGKVVTVTEISFDETKSKLNLTAAARTRKVSWIVWKWASAVSDQACKQ